MYLLRGVHFTSGEHGDLMHGTLGIEHLWSSGHPPLSMAHDARQNGSPVGSLTLHLEPTGHVLLSQGSMATK